MYHFFFLSDNAILYVGLSTFFCETAKINLKFLFYTPYNSYLFFFFRLKNTDYNWNLQIAHVILSLIIDMIERMLYCRMALIGSFSWAIEYWSVIHYFFIFLFFFCISVFSWPYFSTTWWNTITHQIWHELVYGGPRNCRINT